MRSAREALSRVGRAIKENLLQESLESDDGDLAELPWERYQGDLRKVVHKRVLELSRRASTWAPERMAAEPSGTYRPAVYYYRNGKELDDRKVLAATLLEVDPWLRRFRYVAVPRQLPEDVFWSRYFRGLDGYLGRLPDPHAAASRARSNDEALYPAVSAEEGHAIMEDVIIADTPVIDLPPAPPAGATELELVAADEGTATDGGDQWEREVAEEVARIQSEWAM